MHIILIDDSVCPLEHKLLNIVESATGGNPALDIGTTLRVGAWVSGGRNWGGTLDEVRIWDRALSQSEIQSNYDTELVGDETDLLLYYKCNQGIANGDNGSGCPSSIPCEDSASSSAWMLDDTPLLVFVAFGAEAPSKLQKRQRNSFSSSSSSSSSTGFSFKAKHRRHCT